jgi:hypothetical protein
MAMKVEIQNGDSGAWAWVISDGWTVSVWPHDHAILTMHASRGNVQLQGDFATLAEFGPALGAVCGFSIDAATIRTAIEIGNAALAARESEAAE